LRETYTAEKDAMIRFLRDDLENAWPTVAELYNEYWGARSGVDARKLSRRYQAIVPKKFQGRKKVGRVTTGDKARGVAGVEKWPWMVTTGDDGTVNVEIGILGRA
jgi:hypothetical protein